MAPAPLPEIVARETRNVIAVTSSAHLKCWGIGLGRTGTHSICAAFKILGIDRVAHNPTFDHLKMLDGGADNGVSLYYKYIDYKFPGSKFVLTTRDLASWLPSIQYITDRAAIHNRDADEAIKRRMLIYESVVFDRDKYIRAYFRHHDDVNRYFLNRPDDLLIMDITKGDGWEALCRFLKVPIPNEPFPHQNRRA